MDPSCILMCANIPGGISEDVLFELFCIAGPVEDVSISRSGRSCFIIYEFPEAVPTAKEIFKDVRLRGRPLEMFDQNDIKQIHEKQEQESIELQQQEAAFAEIVKQHNPFYNPDSMTPTHHARGRPQNFPPPVNLFDPSLMPFPFPNHFNPPPNFIPPPNVFNVPPPNQSFGDNYDPSVPIRRWGSAPETNQQFSPAELDTFKSPYSQPVSRKNYEQNRRNNYNDNASNSNSNQTPNRSNCYSRRHPENSARNDNQNNDQSKDTNNSEYGYEDQTRRRFHEGSQKSYRGNDRYNHSKHNAGSTSSDYADRNKSRNSYDRQSPYSRNDHKRYDQRDSRRSNHYEDRGYRNHRR